jgi:hypothetical protein
MVNETIYKLEQKRKTDLKVETTKNITLLNEVEPKNRTEKWNRKWELNIVIEKTYYIHAKIRWKQNMEPNI